jgi:hypothetical protein
MPQTNFPVWLEPRNPALRTAVIGRHKRKKPAYRWLSLLFRLPKFPKLFAQLAGGIQVFEPKPYILVGGASFELATPAV